MTWRAIRSWIAEVIAPELKTDYETMTESYGFAEQVRKKQIEMLQQALADATKTTEELYDETYQLMSPERQAVWRLRLG